MRITLTGRERHDITQADALIDGFHGGFVIRDKGCDSNNFLGLIYDMGMEAAMPPRSNRKTPRECDAELYKVRNVMERFIGKVKRFRRVAARCDKLSSVYLGFLHFASIFIWM